MKPLFSKEGLAAMDRLPKNRTLVAFDFDGTIAPIVSDPDDAFTLKNLRAPLTRLAAVSKLVIISGRGVKDVEHRLYFPNDYVVGNHGLEGLPEFKDKAVRAIAVCRKWVAQLERGISRLPKDHGIFVEDKKHSLSLHFRHAKNPLRAMAWLDGEIDNLWPQPRVIGGKLIYNIVPKGSPHKGSALKALMKRFKCTHAVFVGDDVTDEDAFAEKKRGILSIRVGRKKDSKAQFYVKSQNDVLRLLGELQKRLA